MKLVVRHQRAERSLKKKSLWDQKERGNFNYGRG
jgi:hypothetical protein